MDDGFPTLEVGFAIDTGDSFGSLQQLDGLIDQATANAVAEFAKVERASKGMLDLGGATASMKSFGTAATREAASAARELAKVEKAGESLVRQLERQNAAFGKSREELRGMKAEAAAVAAEQRGLTELAARIRAQEAALYDQEFAMQRRAAQEAEAAAQAKALAAQQAVAAAEKEAQALREAAFAYGQFEAAARRGMAIYREEQAAQAAADKIAEAQARERATAALKREADEHARLVALVRGSQAAQEADAAAAEHLRERTDPLYAATKRLNAEIAESTRLYHAGATVPAEYARQQAVLAGRMKEAEQQHLALAGAAGRSGFAVQQFAIQLPDIAQGLLTGQKPMTVFIQQGGQLVQVAMMAQGGIRGFLRELGGAAVVMAPFLVAIGALAAGFELFAHEIQQDAALKSYVEGLGLTHKEMKKLGDVSVTTGDELAGLWKTLSDQMGTSKVFDGFGDKAGAEVHEAYLYFLEGGEAFTAILKASYDTIVAQWRQFPAAFGNSVIEAVNMAGKAIEWLVNKSLDGLSRITHTEISHIDLGAISSPFAKAGRAVGASFRQNYQRELKEAQEQDAQLMAAWGRNTLAHAERRLKDQADKIRGDRTPKTDHHAEQLAREAAATEAQIANLYKLADAYGASGAAALIAEARVKAETAAIKQRGDIEEAVNRQVRLSIAQRVTDGAKAAAAMRDQARLQTEINGMVAAGTIPAERAGELLQQRIAELPLLAAIEAAQQRGLKMEAEKATKALEDQRNAQARVRDAQTGLFYASSDATAERRLAEQREELRLVGATNDERVRALATLRATQELQARGEVLGTTFADNYIAKQVAIAVGAEQLGQAQQAYNEQLTLTADRWDIIAGKVQAAGQGMAEAFGAAGRAIGDLATIFTSYQAQRERAEAEHAKALREAAGNETRVARENQLFALRASGAQIAAYGDMAAAAKGFFAEGSAGYKALATAEKIFRVAQLAMSLQAMVQDTLETGSHVANAAARATADGAAGVAAQAKLPFPLNIAAMAATAAALVAAGIAIVGGHGGHAAPVTNTGTGTVLGDPSAKSESIKNAINDLQKVDTLMLTSSRQMAASLRSIDQQIGGFAAQILKAGDINANAGVSQGFKTDTLGRVLGGDFIPVVQLLKKVPIVGSLVSGITGVIKSLFGSSTKVIGNGLYGGAQSIGEILSGGFDASYYSDVEKKKKFLGVTTSTKTSTQFTAADPTLAGQFTLILRSFDEAIAAAAGPLGVSTQAIQQRLNSFVVDIGKIDLTGLTGDQVTEKLTAIFGAAADQMAAGAFPDIVRFQKAGEGAFETLVRVSSTVEAVTAALTELGVGAQSLGIDAKLGLAAQFDTISDLTGAVDGYFQAFYTPAEQAAAKGAQLGAVFASLGVAMPATLAGFRQLVEAQDLTSAAGQATYATLLQLAPAFAELKASLDSAKSAADVLSERQDLQRQLLELQGDTAALRALDLAKLDASNRGLQQQVWAVQDAQKAADAAEQLRQAWTSIGDSIADEVKRIRGLSGTSAGGGFSALQGQFNAATTAARAGDQDAAKSLPGLSQALLTAAAAAATSRQELDRVQAQTAASLEQTKAAIDAMTGTSAIIATASTAASLAAAASNQAASSPVTAANDDTIAEIRALRSEVVQLRSDNNAGHAATAGNTGRMAKKLDDVTAQSGGDAISTVAAA